jgi:hypothetical protein
MSICRFRQNRSHQNRFGISKEDFNGITANLLWILLRMGCVMHRTPLVLGPLRQLAEGWTFLIAISIRVTVPFVMWAESARFWRQ